MIENEISNSMEKSSLSPFDAVLVHAYWLKEYPDGRLRPSIGGRLQIRAAAELFRRGLVKNIFLAGGRIWGNEYPSLAHVMGEELQRRFHVPTSCIHLVNEAKDTSLEVDLFLAKAHQLGWKNLLGLASNIHLPRIRKLHRSGKIRMEVITNEEVLSNTSPPYKQFIKKLLCSPRVKMYKIYEGVARLIMLIDQDAAFLKKMAETTKNKKTQQFSSY